MIKGKKERLEAHRQAQARYRQRLAANGMRERVITITDAEYERVTSLVARLRAGKGE